MLPQPKALPPPPGVIVVQRHPEGLIGKGKKHRAKKEFIQKSSVWGFLGREKKREGKELKMLKQTKIYASGVSRGTEWAPRLLNGVTGLWVVDTVPYAGSVFTVRWPYNK